MMAKSTKKTMAAKMAADKRYDKARGIKEGSPADKRMDKKRGVKD